MARYKKLTCHTTWWHVVFLYKLGSTAWTLTRWTLADFWHALWTILCFYRPWFRDNTLQTAWWRAAGINPNGYLENQLWRIIGKVPNGNFLERFLFIPNVQPVLTSLTPRMCSRPVHGSVSLKKRILGDRRTKRLNVVVTENAWNKYCRWTAGVIFFAFERRSEFTRNLFFW